MKFSVREIFLLKKTMHGYSWANNEFSDPRDGKANTCDKTGQSFKILPILRFLFFGFLYFAFCSYHKIDAYMSQLC